VRWSPAASLPGRREQGEEDAARLERFPADPHPVGMREGVLGGSRGAPLDRRRRVTQALPPGQIADAANFRLPGSRSWHRALLAACPAPQWRARNAAPIASRNFETAPHVIPRIQCRDCSSAASMRAPATRQRGARRAPEHECRLWATPARDQRNRQKGLAKRGIGDRRQGEVGASPVAIIQK
jgi:hypothetical protein